MRWRLILPIMIAAIIALPGCSRPRPAQARPALFVVRDADTTIWLFGTVHVLPGDLDWETPTIDRAVAASDTLVTELPALDPDKAGATYRDYARGNRQPPVERRLPPALRERYRGAVTKAGLDAAALDGLDSWAVAAAIEQAQAGQQGADVEHGVETVLAARFAGKPRLGLESLTGQLAILDGLSATDQQQMLADALKGPTGYRATLQAWSHGDVAALARIDDQLFAGSPGFERVLLTDRNARWTGWIAGRMARPGSVFVAVGAGHLAGPQSVIAMLAARGLKVARVQ